MNRIEKTILRKAIYFVAHHNKHLWWELKWQIFDSGYQTYYPRQGEFDFTAQQALKNLSLPDQQALIAEWRKANPARANLPDSEIVIIYASLIIEEVVERARLAAYRTNNW